MTKWSYPLGIGILVIAIIRVSFGFQKPALSRLEQIKNKAALFEEKINTDSALFYYKQAVVGYKEQALADSVFALYHHIYQVYVTGLDYEQTTLEAFDAFLGSVESEVFSYNKPRFMAAYYAAKAEYHLHADSPSDSVTHYTKLVQALKSPEASAYLLNCYAVCGQSLYLHNELKDAKDYLSQGEKLLLATPSLENTLYANSFYSTQGVINYAFSDFEKALSSLTKCVAMTESASNVDTLSLVTDYANLASIYGELGDSERELVYYQKIITLIEQANLPESELGATYANMGVTYKFKNEYKLAIEYSKKALQIAQKYKQVAIEINASSNLVASYTQLGHLDSAKVLVEHLLDIHKKNNTNYQIAYSYSGAIQIAIAERNYSKALEYANVMVSLVLAKYGGKSEILANGYRQMGDAYAGLGRYEEALQSYQKALEALSLNFTSTSYIDVPAADNVSDKATFMKILQQRIKALKGYRKLRPDAIKIEDIYSQAKMAISALQAYQQNLSLASKEFSLSLHAATYYSQAVELAVELYKNTNNPKFLEEAFALSEQSKSSLLLESINAEQVGLEGVPDSLLKREKELANLITQIEKKRFDAALRKDSVEIGFQDELLFKYRRESDQLQNDLKANYSKYYNEKHNVKIADIATMQQSLNNETVLIEYFASDSAYYIFILEKEKFHLTQVPLSDTLLLKLKTYQRSLMSAREAAREPVQTYNAYISASYDLFQTFVAPALQNLTAKRLIIIPDGYLGYVPFESFVVEPKQPITDAKLADYSQLPYLLYKYTINYNYSAMLWYEQISQDNKVVSTSCLGMASTYKNRTTPANRSPRERQLRRVMNELTGVVDEIEFLEKNWSGEFFIDTASTEQVFREHASQHGILHLAMHGIVDEENPEYSCLAFSENGDTTNDNFLYAYEIKQLNLNAALVVLSACETAAGKYLHGEGILSLGRGFMYAGAPSLVTTLWQLNDQAGATLIKLFYENLRLHMDKDEAIRQAKIAYLKQMQHSAAHPALWACFIQVGDYRPLETRSDTPIMIYAGIGGLLAMIAVGWWKLRSKNQLG